MNKLLEKKQHQLTASSSPWYIERTNPCNHSTQKQ